MAFLTRPSSCPHQQSRTRSQGLPASTSITASCQSNASVIVKPAVHSILDLCCTRHLWGEGHAPRLPLDMVWLLPTCPAASPPHSMQALDHQREVVTEPVECAPCWGLCIACPHCSQCPVPSPAPILGLSTLFLDIQLRESLLKGGGKGVSRHPLPPTLPVWVRGPSPGGGR